MIEMNKEDIQMYEEDKELDEMFHGEPKPLHPNTIYITSEKPNTKPVPEKQSISTNQKEKKNEDAKWEPVKPEPNLFDNLKACVKGVGLFAGLNALLFYWQQTGQMETSAAFPSMCVCFALAGFCVGKVVARGKR